MTRGGGDGTPFAAIDPVREFIRAFNEADLDAFVEVLDPEVVLHSMSGLRRGRDEARRWATRKPGGVQQTIELEELRGVDGRRAALIRRRWYWEQDGSLAADEEMAWTFTLRDGKVLTWRPYEDRAAALDSLSEPS